MNTDDPCFECGLHPSKRVIMRQKASPPSPTRSLPRLSLKHSRTSFKSSAQLLSHSFARSTNCWYPIEAPELDVLPFWRSSSPLLELLSDRVCKTMSVCLVLLFTPHGVHCLYHLLTADSKCRAKNALVPSHVRLVVYPKRRPSSSHLCTRTWGVKSHHPVHRDV